jgi:hypothetical protein
MNFGVIVAGCPLSKIERYFKAFRLHIVIRIIPTFIVL